MIIYLDWFYFEKITKICDMFQSQQNLVIERLMIKKVREKTKIMKTDTPLGYALKHQVHKIKGSPLQSKREQAKSYSKAKVKGTSTTPMKKIIISASKVKQPIKFKLTSARQIRPLCPSATLNMSSIEYHTPSATDFLMEGINTEMGDQLDNWEQNQQMRKVPVFVIKISQAHLQIQGSKKHRMNSESITQELHQIYSGKFKIARIQQPISNILKHR